MLLTTSTLGNQLSLISTVAARMVDSWAIAATAKPTSINTNNANAPDRRVEIFKFFMEPSFRRLETLHSSSCASFGTCIAGHKTELLAKTATLLGYTALKIATPPENLIFAITHEFIARSNNPNSSKIGITNKTKQILISVKSERWPMLPATHAQPQPAQAWNLS